MIAIKPCRAYGTKKACQLCNKYYPASSLWRHQRIAHRGHFQGSKPAAEPLTRPPIKSTIHEDLPSGGDGSAPFPEEMSCTPTEIDDNSPFSMDLDASEPNPVVSGDLAHYSNSVIINDDAGIIVNNNGFEFEESRIVDIEPELPTGPSCWRTVCHEQAGN